MKKVIFITNVPAPYRVAMLNKASIILHSKGIILKVLFSTDAYKRRHYWNTNLTHVKFQYGVLNGYKLEIGEKLLMFNWSLPFVLRKEQPSIVISAGYSIPTMLACLYTWCYRVRFIIYSGETRAQANKRKLEWLRIYARKLLLSRCSAYIAYGTEAKYFLKEHNISDAKIFIAINSVDTEELQRRMRSEKNQGNLSDGSIRMLFVGNLQKLKGLEYVLKAMQNLRDQTVDIRFDIVGGGPDEGRLRKLSKNFKLDHVTFWGPQKPENVIPFYTRASVFVFPSLYDIFGLVMVEAAAAGLPIIASRLAGGTIDIVEDGKNGYVVDPRNIDELAARIAELSGDKAKREAMGRHSLKIIDERINLSQSAQGFADAVVATLEGQG